MFSVIIKKRCTKKLQNRTSLEAMLTKLKGWERARSKDAKNLLVWMSGRV